LRFLVIWLRQLASHAVGNYIHHIVVLLNLLPNISVLCGLFSRLTECICNHSNICSVCIWRGPDTSRTVFWNTLDVDYGTPSLATNKATSRTMKYVRHRDCFLPHILLVNSGNKNKLSYHLFPRKWILFRLGQLYSDAIHTAAISYRYSDDRESEHTLCWCFVLAQSLVESPFVSHCRTMWYSIVLLECIRCLLDHTVKYIFYWTLIFKFELYSVVYIQHVVSPPNFSSPLYQQQRLSYTRLFVSVEIAKFYRYDRHQIQIIATPTSASTLPKRNAQGLCTFGIR
jgi:hypothetical protein